MRLWWTQGKGQFLRFRLETQRLRRCGGSLGPFLRLWGRWRVLDDGDRAAVRTEGWCRPLPDIMSGYGTELKLHQDSQLGGHI